MDEVWKNLCEIEMIRKHIQDNLDDLENVKPKGFFQFHVMRVLFRLAYNQDRIVNLLRIIYRDIKE